MPEKFQGGIVCAMTGVVLVLAAFILAPSMEVAINPKTIVIMIGFCAIIAGLSLILAGIVDYM